MRGTLPPWVEKLNYVRVLVISGILIFVGILFGFITPPLFKNLVKGQLNLTPKSEVRPLYVNTPFYLNFKVYVFNLLNPDEVTKGGKPRVQELGPYFFEEWKEKFDLVDDEEADTLTYHYKNTFKFRPDLSGPGLTGNEIITMPHPFIATVFLAINVDKQPMLPLINEAIDTLFQNPQHMFYTGRVMDILFDGIPINCTTDVFQAKAVCNALEGGEIKAIQSVANNQYKFSFFGAANGTDLGEVKVYRGYKNSPDMGRVLAVNGEDELDVWEEGCNQYQGTDSTIFAPYMNKHDGIWAYEPTICRALKAHHVGKSKYMGVKTASFEIDIFSADNIKDCYCREEDACPKKGTFDLYPCVEAPLIASHPHFYGADENLLKNFESGLNPVKEDHVMFMQFEMVTGTPLKAAKRLQFNLEIVPIEEVPYMADLREMYYPLFWIEESAALEKEYVKPVKLLMLMIKIQKLFKWMGLIFGFLGMILGGVLIMIAEETGAVQSAPPRSSATKIDVQSIDKET